MKVFFIGIGLIGGSMALEIKHKNPQAVCYGISRQDETLDRALALGLIDHKAVWEDLPQADLVFLSIPVDASVNALPRILDLIPDQSLVVDAGSTKQALCTAVAQHPKRRNYLAAHPIAGTEFSGPEAAFLGLFDQKTMIVCEVEKTAFKLQEKAMSLFTSWGMRIRYMDAAAHDKHIAYVSHLSHISSFMLGKTVIEKEKNEFKPDVFVFENVPGLLSAYPGGAFVTERIYKAFDKIGYAIRNPELLKKSVYSASDLGVPQKRN